VQFGNLPNTHKLLGISTKFCFKASAFGGTAQGNVFNDFDIVFWSGNIYY